VTTKARRPRRRLTVAIDGPAGAGKSTAARRLAAALGYQVLDTGAIYRAVALAARRAGVAWDDGPRLAALARDLDIRFEVDRGGNNRVVVGGEDVSAAIRTPEISDGASRVSGLPGVRAALLDLQRRLGAAGGVIAEGRDVGTVVFPEAGAKFFLTASADVRARRRHDELAATGAPAADLASTRSEIEARDARDSQRAVAPLVRADDAIEIDSSTLGIDAVVHRMIRIVRVRERGDRGGA
jgi:cytidylate kinase